MGHVCRPHGMWVKLVGIVVIGLLLGLALLKDQIFSTETNSIQVTGQGHVAVHPDMAQLNLSIVTFTASTQEEAVTQTTAKVNKVLAALDQLGISAENRQLTGYAVSPRYNTPDQSEESPEIHGYTATEQLTVRVPIKDDQSMIDKVIAAAAKEGVNQVGEVKLIASDIETLKQEARVKAVADATSKVDAVAQAARVKVKTINSWYENFSSTPNDPVSRDSYYAPTPTTQLPVTPQNIITLQPGQLELVVEINVTYEVGKK